MSKQNLPDNRGFSYDVSEERIRFWKSISAREKLEWLEEANNFLRKAFSPQKKQTMNKFRKGEL